jgi:5,10-methylenetetrahydromethanopterin reductase
VPGVDVGLYPTRSVAELAELGAAAESLGFDRVWVADSPVIWRELWVTLGALAMRTERVRLGSAVTTGLTRHPAVTASAALSVAEATGGRFDLGVGSGDSSIVTTGGQPQSLAAFRRTVETLRRLLGGSPPVAGASATRVEAATGDAVARIAWARAPHVPVYVAASGPRMLELAGAIADGVIVMVGVSETMVRAAIERVRAGARSAGRDPDAVAVVVWTACAVSDEAPEVAVAAVKATVARTVIRTLPASVTPEHAVAVDSIRAAYDYAWHSDARAPHAALVPDALVSDFAVAGDSTTCAARLRALASLGVSAVALALPDADVDVDERAAMLTRLATAVVPAT